MHIFAYLKRQKKPHISSFLLPYTNYDGLGYEEKINNKKTNVLREIRGPAVKQDDFNIQLPFHEWIYLYF